MERTQPVRPGLARAALLIAVGIAAVAASIRPSVARAQTPKLDTGSACCAPSNAGTAVSAARCEGKTPCPACSDCSRCAYCRAGGSCGTCAAGGKAAAPIVRAPTPLPVTGTASQGYLAMRATSDLLRALLPRGTVLVFVAGVRDAGGTRPAADVERAERETGVSGNARLLGAGAVPGFPGRYYLLVRPAPKGERPRDDALVMEYEDEGEWRRQAARLLGRQGVLAVEAEAAFPHGPARLLPTARLLGSDVAAAAADSVPSDILPAVRWARAGVPAGTHWATWFVRGDDLPHRDHAPEATLGQGVSTPTGVGYRVVLCRDASASPRGGPPAYVVVVHLYPRQGQ